MVALDMGARTATDKQAPKRKCFVVGEYGKDEAERKRSSQVLKYIIRAALADDFEVIRADELPDPGQITDQIVRHLVEDALVVADLSRPNPNVYYEVGVRHSAAKPIVHLMEEGQRLPFDLQGERAIPYNINDIESVEKARDDVKRAVKALEASDWQPGKNPVSSAAEISMLSRSPDEQDRAQAEVLGMLSALMSQVRALERRLPPDPHAKLRLTPKALKGAALRHNIVEWLEMQTEGAGEPMLWKASEVADNFGLPESYIRSVLQELASEGRITEWTAVDPEETDEPPSYSALR